MTRTALYGAIVAVVVALAVGWGLGIVMSTRVNTVAVMAYVRSLDIEADRIRTRQAAEQESSCDARVLALEGRLRQQERAFVVQVQDEQAHYSARILWLQQALRAHGIQEVVVR